MDKPTLRCHIRAARLTLHEASSDAAKAARAAAIADAVAGEPEVVAACRDRATIAAYCSYNTEPPTVALIEKLINLGANVVLPSIREPSAPLRWVAADGRLEPDDRGIPTPTGPALAHNAADLLALNCRVIIIPSLAVAFDGTRLGQGGGYYDRLLAQFPAHQSIGAGPARLTIVAASEVFDALPTDQYDQPVDRWIIG